MSSPLSQGTCLVVLVVACVISYVPFVLCVMCCSPLPPLRVRCTILSDSAVIWGCTSMCYRLVIMRVCVRLHGTLYPMTDCVLYLGQTIVLAVQPGSADIPQASLQFHYH